MEDSNKQLYPMAFLEEGTDTPWGRCTYHLADLGTVDSMVAEGWFGGNTLSELMGIYLERVVGDDSFEYYGLQFPVMVKEMKTTGWQPLQVNVSDKVAEERYDSFGKTAFWYIKEAAGDARMFLGLSRDVDAGEFYLRCQDGSVKEILNEVPLKKGDCLVIRPGTVFAAGPGLTIVEIAECSELTLDLGTELEEAFDLIDFHHHSPQVVPEAPPQGNDSAGRILADCDEFTVRKFDLKDPVHIYSEQPGSFAVCHCLAGEALIQAPSESGKPGDWDLKAGRTMLVPSEVNDYLICPVREGTVLLEATIRRRALTDSYTDGSPEEETPDPHLKHWN